MFRALLLASIVNIVKTQTPAKMSGLTAVDFEVFGIVQGVFFRKHTKEKADELQIRGWCMNTRDGTVKGQLQGPHDKVQSMMSWLRDVGSPSSKIERAEFKNQADISDFTFKGFEIRK